MGKKAFTLVELLVVIAIIGILVGIILPAVQQIRETARRTKCMNNVRQLALACHNFESTHGHFPPGSAYWAASGTQRYIDSSIWDNRSGTAHEGNYPSWHRFILPFVEQNSLYEKLDIKVSWGEDFTDPATGQHLTGTALPLFMCPSDSTSSGFNDTYYTNKASRSYAPEIRKNGKSNYVACTGWNTSIGNQGPRLAWDQSKMQMMAARWGIFRINSKVEIRNISDGTSSTIMLGERSSEKEEGYNAVSQQGAIWAGRFHPINEPAAVIEDRGNYAWGGRTGGAAYLVNGWHRSRNICSSGHPGGGTVALADGSGHFLNENLANSVLRNLSCMADGNIANGF
jgi:prepilin-type N-terminal cleavage/methylation domain-containing protein